MTKEWYSASELAGISGMPKYARGVNIKASRENWNRQKKQKGKGWEYHVSSLPTETCTELFHQQAIETINARADKFTLSGEALGEAELARIEEEKTARLKIKEQGLKDFAALPDGPKKQRIKARQWVVEALFVYRRHHKCNKQSSRIGFVSAFNEGDVNAPDWVYEQMPKYNGTRTLTKGSLQRWEENYINKGIMALADNYGQSKGRSKIETNPELKKVVLGSIFKYPHITPKKIKQFLQAAHPELDIVSIKGVERYIKSWKADNEQLWVYMTNPDKWKNQFMVAFGSHFENINELNKLWELDSTPGDWMLTDGRHSVLGVIDLYSRRLKFFVSKTSKAMAVCQVFRRAVLDWGVPEHIRTDNGKDYISDQFVDVIDALEIMQELCIPFASEEKGTIERAMRTMSHGILDLLPGFIGHNVAERKVIEARKSFADRIMKSGEVVEVAISSDELQEKLDQWTDHVYAHDVHSGLKGKTPWEVAAAWTKPVKRIEDEHALDMLLAENAGTRTVNKKGITFNGKNYFHQALTEFVGREARIKYDEQDLGRLAVYIDNVFICWAEDPDQTGISRKEWALVSKAHQKKFLSIQSAEYSQFKRDLKANIPEVVLEHRIEQSEKLTAFPQRSEPYTTPALEQAGFAARGRQPDRAELSEREKELQQQITEELKQPVVHHLSESETPQERYAHMARIERQIENGENVDEALRKQLECYQQGPEYRSMKMFFEDFGLPIDREAK